MFNFVKVGTAVTSLKHGGVQNHHKMLSSARHQVREHLNDAWWQHPWSSINNFHLLRKAAAGIDWDTVLDKSEKIAEVTGH